LACGGEVTESGAAVMTGPPGRQSTGPSRVWYWVAGAAVVAAVVWLGVGIFLGIRAFSRQVEGFQRVPIPGQAELRLDEPGGYTVYYEGLGAADEQVTIPSFSVSVTPVGRDQEIPIRPYGGSSTYTVGGQSGRAVGTFRIDAPGAYLVRTDGDTAGQPQVAIGASIGPAIGRTVALTVPVALLLFFGGGALALVVAVRRRKTPGQPPAPASWTQPAVPAGWFADPSRQHEHRYWDGQRWTERVADRGAEAVDPM
jgi:Protein of unknown function (DUF2510)